VESDLSVRRKRGASAPQEAADCARRRRPPPSTPRADVLFIGALSLTPSLLHSLFAPRACYYQHTR
jgi:hypothetical protein